MRAARILACSTASFVSTLLGRRDPAVKRSPLGLAQLEGWDSLPEEKKLLRERARLNGEPETCSFLLYCYEGAHQGEVFFLRGKRSTAGTSAACDVVLTAGEHPEAQYEFNSDEGLEIRGSAPHCFELNGKPEYYAKLVDYDELAFCENRFLVLELGGEKT